MSSKANSIGISSGLGSLETPPNSVALSLTRLNKITATLQRLSSVIISLTLLNVATFWFIFFPAPYYPAFGTLRTILLRIGFFLFTIVAVSVAVFRYEQHRRKGDALFDEVSDELEWDIKGRQSKVANERPDLETRVVLRSFVKATDLPFAPGKFGPALYFLFNFLSSVLALWVSRGVF